MGKKLFFSLLIQGRGCNDLVRPTSCLLPFSLEERFDFQNNQRTEYLLRLYQPDIGGQTANCVANTFLPE